MRSQNSKRAADFGDAFPARQTRAAQRQRRGFHRLAVAQFVSFADFKQAHVALAVIQIPFERAHMLTDAGRAHHGRIFGERIPDGAGSDAFRTEHRVASRFDQRDRDNFLIAEADESLAQAVLCFGMRQARAGCFAGGRRGGNLS